MQAIQLITVSGQTFVLDILYSFSDDTICTELFIKTAPLRQNALEDCDSMCMFLCSCPCDIVNFNAVFIFSLTFYRICYR